MIPVFSSRVFAIADPGRSLFHIDIRPFYPTDLSLAHCGRHGEAKDPSKWNELLAITFQHIRSTDSAHLEWADDRARSTFLRGQGVLVQLGLG